MILFYKIKKGFPCVIPKKILSEGKTYTFQNSLPEDEAFQARFFGLWEKANKSAKNELLAGGN